MTQVAQSGISRSSGPWQPLRNGTFRNLLAANLISDIGTFMQTVGAAWLMTSITSSPLYIALIQTASALPFFLLALPAGSIGDIFDRRKLILGTETWMLGIAVVLTVVTFAGMMHLGSCSCSLWGFDWRCGRIAHLEGNLSRTGN